MVDVRLSRSDRSHTPECEYSRSETTHERSIRQKQIDMNFLAQVVELVDTTVLEAVAVRCKSSSLFLGTILGFMIRLIKIMREISYSAILPIS